MLFTVSTVKESVAGLEQFVARNLAGGVDHLFLFVDDLEPDGHRRARPAPARHRDRDRRELVARQAAATAQRPAAHQRQRRQGDARRVDAGPDDWIFHIDGDEALQVDRAALAALPADVPVVRMPPLEAVSRKKWPGGKVTHFKKMLAPEELTAPARARRDRGADQRPLLPRALRREVRAAADPRPLDHPAHRARRRPADRCDAGRSGSGRMLHYESWSGEEFVRKWTNILESGSKVSFRPVREPTAVALRSLVRRELPKRSDAEVPPADLRAHHRGRLRDAARPRPPREDRPAGRQARAGAAGPDGDAELRAMFAAVEPGEQVGVPHRAHRDATWSARLRRRLAAASTPALAERVATALDAARGAAAPRRQDETPTERPADSRHAWSGQRVGLRPDRDDQAVGQQAGQAPAPLGRVGPHRVETDCGGPAPSLSRSTAISRPRHCRSVPSQAWPRRAGPSYAG